MKRAGLVVLLLALFWVVWLAVQDVSLELDDLKVGKANLPDMSFERLEFQRELEGVEWTASVDRAERRGKEISLVSLDVSGVEDEGRRWSLQAPKGVFLEELRRAELSDVRGALILGSETAFFEAPKAEWVEGETEVLFAEGASFRRGNLSFQGNLVRASFTGMFSAEKGASVTWSVPEKTE